VDKLLLKEYSYKLGFCSLCVGTFFLSFPLKWSLYPLGLFLVFGLFEWVYDFRELKKMFFRKIHLVLPPILYFFLHLVYFLFVQPKWYYIERNLFLILIPLFGFPIFVNSIFIKNVNIFIKCFISGLIIISLFEVLRASQIDIFQFNIKQLRNLELDTPSSRFMSFNLSVFEHPIYLSMKILFAIFLIIQLRHNLRIPRILSISISVLLLVFLYFLSSRTGFLILIFLSIFTLYQFLRQYRLRWLLLFLAPLILFAVIKLSISNSRISFRTESFLERWNSEERKLKDVDVRFTTWFTAIDLIKEHPLFGVGLNSLDILSDEYRRQGYINEAKLRLNAHNQFLETQLTFGLPGTLILLWMLFIPLFGKHNSGNHLIYKAFLIIIVTGFSFASGLERQYCLTFFVLFYTFLILWHPPKSINTNSS
jgi:O-antigen ligase